MNIYKKYRKLAGLTQEKASEHLYISVEALKKYEIGAVIPNNDIVAKMCITYNDNRLAYEHLTNSTIGVEVLPKLEDKQLAHATLSLISSLNNIVGKEKLIIEICEDNIVDEKEEKEWDEIKKDITKLIKNSFEVIYKRG